MNINRNILLVGPFPPAIGGVAAINQMIYQCFDNIFYKIISFNSSRFQRKPNTLSATGLINVLLQFAQIISIAYLMKRYNCSIVHIATSSYHSFFKSALVVLIASCLRKKILIHLHGGAFDIFYENSNSIVRWFIHYIFDKSDCIITLSKYWKKVVTDKLQITPEKVVILYNTYGFEFDKLEDSIEKLQSKRNGNLIRILFIGSLSMKKGILDLVEICAEVRKDFDKFILYLAGGEGEKGMMEKVKNAISDNRLMEHIIVLGEIKGDDRLELFRKSDIFILPSYVENFPVTILEAMRAGLPVITTNVGAIPEILKELENGFMVTPGDVAKFTEKVLLLVNNRRLRDSIANANLKKALDQFNPQYYSLDLAKIYDEMLRK